MKIPAVVWCEGAFRETIGKTAHGLVRFTDRFQVLSVIDSTCAGQDAGSVLDGRPRGIPLLASLDAALQHAGSERGRPAFVYGLAPDGGRFRPADLRAIRAAIAAGMDVAAGLHDFLNEDAELVALARQAGVTLTDVRRPPPARELHHWSGEIEAVGAVRVAVLGTDSAVGKRTTAVMLVHALRAAGRSAELVGTGQTSWFQGAPYGIVLDSLINDFVAGELEHAAVRAWRERQPEVLVIEGQGSLLHPAYPGGFEILAALRPQGIVLQHAPARRLYDGFPDTPLHPLSLQRHALELVSGRPVVALALNLEGIPADRHASVIEAHARESGLPCCAPVSPASGIEPLVEVVANLRREPAP